MEQMNYVIVGPPGSGKGTQAGLLAEKLGLPHISTGDEFRRIREEDSDLGRKVKELIDAGNLVPDDVVNEMMVKRIKSPELAKGVVLDGYPRTVPQGEFFDKESHVTKCVFINVSDDECIRRMGARRVCSQCEQNYNTLYIKPKNEGVCDSCSGELIIRDDSSPEKIKNRMIVYYDLTKPLVDYYEAKGMILEVNGDQEIEKVFAEIVKGLE